MERPSVALTIYSHVTAPLLVDFTPGRRDVHLELYPALPTGFERLYVFQRGGSFFGTRTKRAILFRRRYSHPIDTTPGLRSDHTVMPGSATSMKHYPDPLRCIHYHDAEQHRNLWFLTNTFDLPHSPSARRQSCRSNSPASSTGVTTAGRMRLKPLSVCHVPAFVCHNYR